MAPNYSTFFGKQDSILWNRLKSIRTAQMKLHFYCTDEINDFVTKKNNILHILKVNTTWSKRGVWGHTYSLIQCCLSTSTAIPALGIANILYGIFASCRKQAVLWGDRRITAVTWNTAGVQAVLSNRKAWGKWWENQRRGGGTGEGTDPGVCSTGRCLKSPIQ